MSITKFGFPVAAALASVLSLSSPADAQQPAAPAAAPPKITLTSLTAQGFEMKAAVPAGGDFQVVYLQKGKDAYACIVAHLAQNDPWKSDCYPMQ